MSVDLAAEIAALKRRVADLEGLEIPSFVAGTWTPTYLGSTTPGATTYVAQLGAYIKLDSLVLFTLTVQWSAATGTGNPRISLPFTAANAGQNFAPGIWHTTVTFANGDVNVLLSPGVNTLRLFSPATNAATAELAIEAAGLVVISGWYIAA